MEEITGESDDSTEPVGDSTRKFSTIPHTPLIPASILDFAASELSAPLLESIRQATDSQARQMQTMFLKLPQFDLSSLMPQIRVATELTTQVNRLIEKQNRVLLESMAAALKFQKLRIDTSGWLSPNPFKNLKLPNLADLIPNWLTPELLEQMRQWRRVSRPSNWDDSIEDEAAEQLAAAGWPIVWVPRASIVRQLVEAQDDDARRLLLVVHADQILDDCEAALESIAAEELLLLRRLANEAVSAAHHDLLGAAQATAAVVADTSCHDFWELTRNGEILRNANPDVETVPISGLLKTLCLAIIAAAFATFRPENGDPVPDTYNRHATIHRASEPQYSKANALQAIMTAVVAVCQIDHELARDDPPDDDEEEAA